MYTEGATMQGNGKQSPPIVDPIYIPFMNDVTSIRNACTIAITDLYAAGRSDLTAPFARILGYLAEVDTAALESLDEAHHELRP